MYLYHFVGCLKYSWTAQKFIISLVGNTTEEDVLEWTEQVIISDGL